MNINKALKGYGVYKAYDQVKDSKIAHDAAKWALAKAGLERRRTMSKFFGGFGMIAAGMVIGGAVGMFFAPMRGAEIRSTMRQKGFKRAAEKLRAEMAHA